MMLTLGLFVFQLQTLPYQSLQHSLDYRWPSNSRIGQRPAYQFLGVGEEKIMLSGVLLPEITGGVLSLLALKIMAEQGKAWPLLGGDGTIYGMYTVASITQTHSVFFSDGRARRIEFSMTLNRVDESLKMIFGDLQQQARDLLQQVAGRLP
ncbi:phage tail protein [Yersinia enterocolitica]|uniref:phage tail protein n=1 Tax=Yersinia enterocolitica TaxID=630 RepID=UPI00313404A6|nr:phage tail protein [Yersinia enterocolitica]EKN4798134.1 phage tail protein [Yersinia enterocolitica]EKN5108367.1 phage tail protein [Yersinia enterocolitica]